MRQENVTSKLKTKLTSSKIETCTNISGDRIKLRQITPRNYASISHHGYSRVHQNPFWNFYTFLTCEDLIDATMYKSLTLNSLKDGQILAKILQVADGEKHVQPYELGVQDSGRPAKYKGRRHTISNASAKQTCPLGWEVSSKQLQPKGYIWNIKIETTWHFVLQPSYATVWRVPQDNILFYQSTKGGQ